jgi:hypothetical protein
LRGRAGAWTWRLHQIGFVLPKSTKLSRSGDRDPRIARPAEIGFVLPKSAQPGGGGDGAPQIAPRRRGGRQLQRIECPDRELSPRQRPPLVAIEPHQPRGGVRRRKTFREDLRAQAADTLDVDLRLGDTERGGAARLARALPGDPPRQRGDLGRKREVGHHRQAQPVAQRVARHHGLAGARARPGAARRIDAVGGADRGAGHAPSSTGGGAIASRLFSMQHSNLSARVFHWMRHRRRRQDVCARSAVRRFPTCLWLRRVQ